MAMAIEKEHKHMNYALLPQSMFDQRLEIKEIAQLLLRIAITRSSLVIADIERFN